MVLSWSTSDKHKVKDTKNLLYQSIITIKTFRNFKSNLNLKYPGRHFFSNCIRRRSVLNYRANSRNILKHIIWYVAYQKSKYKISKISVNYWDILLIRKWSTSSKSSWHRENTETISRLEHPTFHIIPQTGPVLEK